MSAETSIEKPPSQAIDRPVTDPAARTAVVDELESQVLLIKEAMQRTLQKGVHYGTIPGTKKPSLWQPGAEMLCQMFRFQTDLIRTGEYEDWEKGVFSYTYKCRLMNRTGELITEREGTCSSKEPNYSKSDPYQIRETLMQMAQKRAYVSAVKGAGAASAIFSQDDDIVADTKADQGFGKCPWHDAPYFKTEKMRSPAHKYGPDDPLDGPLWCNEGDADPRPPRPTQQTAKWQTDYYREAVDALNTLYGAGQDSADQRSAYVSDVLGRDVITADDIKAVTDDEWIKVKESAVGDLAAMESAPEGDPAAAAEIANVGSDDAGDRPW